MSKSDDLKTIAQLRQAIAPLIPLLKAEANQDVSKRLEGIEVIVSELAKRDTAVTVKAPDVHVTSEVDAQKIADAIIESRKSDPTPQLIKSITKGTKTVDLNAYRPHDQDDTMPGNEFYGFVNPDGAWYILNSQGGTQRYAAGKSGYPVAWEKRFKQGYGYLNEVL